MLVVALMMVLGCRGEDCANTERFTVYVDADGDGWGTDEPAGKVCEAGRNQALVSGDCNDDDPDVHPDAEEACNGLDDDCDGAPDEGLEASLPFFADTDEDGYGDAQNAVVACAAPPGYADNDSDCDDRDPMVNPGRAELCNGIDDDCDGVSDDDDPDVEPTSMSSWYPDGDGDGYGRAGVEPLMACASPKGAVDNDLDCDDGVPEINPDATEICNLADDDCDGYADDLDPSIDVGLLTEFYVDADGDGAGNPQATVLLCAPRPGFGVPNAGDCDDSDAAVGPMATEVLCDTVDNDCDPLTPDDRDSDADGFFACASDCDDADPDVYPGAPETPADARDSDCDGLEACYQDVDGDGARTAVPVAVADPTCTTAPNVPPVRPIDCDDNDPLYDWTGRWVRDTDQDGFGAGPVVLTQCPDPGPGFVLEGGDVDCDDGSPAVFPGAPDACNDGVDADCDTSDACTTCQAWLDSDPLLADGVYPVRPDGLDEVDVYCDMTTDGGGWTLVGSTFGLPLTDSAASHHTELATLEPAFPRPGVWSGLRPVVTGNADLRFACKAAALDTSMAVDLSFYDVDWYTEITNGTDAASCFAEAGNPPAPPGRRDNLTGDVRLPGDAWDDGGLVGEDTCGDTDDFTVDFDDRGMDGDEGDGTDWGEDDGKPKCGDSNAGEAWFLFVREP